MRPRTQVAPIYPPAFRELCGMWVLVSHARPEDVFGVYMVFNDGGWV